MDLLQCLGTVRVIVAYIRVHILQQVFFGCNVVEVRGMMDDGRLRELGIRPVLHFGHFLMVKNLITKVGKILGDFMSILSYITF